MYSFGKPVSSRSTRKSYPILKNGEKVGELVYSVTSRYNRKTTRSDTERSLWAYIGEISTKVGETTHEQILNWDEAHYANFGGIVAAKRIILKCLDS